MRRLPLFAVVLLVVLAGLGYVANWRFVLRDLSYADLFSDPSPVQHFWSLAIEEQLAITAGRRQSSRHNEAREPRC